MSDNQPNLIFIITDQQRWDTASIYGNPVIRTPNIDRLGREGIVFDRAYCASPICCATRATLLTGRSAYHPAYFDYLDIRDPEDTVPGHLRRVGYRTQGIGKFHFHSSQLRKLNGFDAILFSEEMRWFLGAASAEAVDFDDYDRYLIERRLWGWEKPQEIGYNELKPLVNPLPREHHITQWCGDRTVEWLRQNSHTPFLLWCSFVKPHPPYDVPAHLKDLYDPADLPAPWRVAGELDRYPFYRGFHEEMEWHLYSETAGRLARAYYYANISFIDEQIGRIVKTLEEAGQLDNTIIVFTSDHGDLLGDHDLWHKSFGYEGSVRVPLIIWGPRFFAGGRRVVTPVSHYDLPVTLMDWGGASFGSQERPGADLLAIADGKVQREGVVSMYGGFHACHRDWKYNFYPIGGYEELFDLENDPHELRNLAGDPTYAEAKRKLKQQIVAFLKDNVAGLRDCISGFRLDGEGDFVVLPCEPSSYVQGPIPYARMPWMSRRPPRLIQEQGGDTGWWWEHFDQDMLNMLPPAVHKRCFP